MHEYLLYRSIKWIMLTYAMATLVKGDWKTPPILSEEQCDFINVRSETPFAFQGNTSQISFYQRWGRSPSFTKFDIDQRLILFLISGFYHLYSFFTLNTDILPKRKKLYEFQ